MKVAYAKLQLEFELGKSLVERSNKVK